MLCTLCRVAEARGLSYNRFTPERGWALVAVSAQAAEAKVIVEQWPACSQKCLDGLKRLVDADLMSELTQMEKNAIKSARRQFAEALDRHDLMRHFAELDAAVIDDLIGSAIEGYRAAMQLASARGDTPF